MRHPLCRCLLAFTLTLPLAATRGDEVCAACDHLVQVTGEISHFNVRDDKPIQGAPAGGEAAYRSEIWGKSFVITVAHLPAGKYPVAIGEAENYFTQPGQRVFDVVCGDTALVTNFDIFSSAGGSGKVCL